MPQLSTALIDDVRSHLIERWQHDAIYQRFANARTEYQGPPTIRQFVADMLALPSLALRDSRFAGNEKLLGRPPFCQLDRSRFGELLATTVLMNGLPTTIDTLALLHVFIPSLRTVLETDICSYSARRGAEERAQFDLVASCGLPHEAVLQVDHAPSASPGVGRLAMAGDSGTAHPAAIDRLLHNEPDRWLVRGLRLPYGLGPRLHGAHQHRCRPRLAP